MTKEEQRLLDAIYAAETNDEKTQALIEAFKAVPEDKIPLMLLLMEERDRDNRDRIIREYFKASSRYRVS